MQNRKLYSLKSALRIDTAKAVGTLALLWLWAIDNARGGSLGRISDRQLAEICQFSPRRAAELRDALVSSGFLDPAGDDLVIHDWDDFGGRLEKRRERDRSYQRGRRRADVGADSASGRDTEQNTADQNRPDKTIADQMRQDNITFSGGDGGARAESDNDFDEAGDYLLSREGGTRERFSCAAVCSAMEPTFALTCLSASASIADARARASFSI